MRKILFCWELGEDYGHLGKILMLSREFSKDPVLFFVISKSLPPASDIQWPDNVRFIQAPIWLRSNPAALKSTSFAEILLYKGYDSYQHLKTLADAWLHLFELITPDIILFDFSPTALIAASNLNVPKIIISNPFLTPPPGVTAKNLAPGSEFDETKAIHIHQKVIESINSVRCTYKVGPVEAIGDLFTADEIYLSGFFETDFFKGHRSSATYCGAALATSIGSQPPQWKPSLTNKSIAYLKHRDPRSKIILHVLASMQARTVCFYLDSKDEDSKEFSNSSLTVSNIPFDLTHALKESEAIICHGGQGVINEALTRGIPLILVPTQAEQYFVAEKMRSMGVGIIINRHDTHTEIYNKISNFFSSPQYKEKAKYLAETQFNIDVESTRRDMAAKIRSFIY